MIDYLPDNHREQLHRISELFIEAERAIKEIEDVGGELVVPAVNQLRYTGNHLIRYLSNPDDTEELRDAFKHCQRATYDAYEAAITYQLLEFKTFQNDYRKVQVSAVILDYSDIKHAIEEARRFIRDNNESKTRGDFYKNGRQHLRTITANVTRLNDSRDELNQLIRSELRKLLFMILGGIGAISAVVSLIIRC